MSILTTFVPSREDQERRVYFVSPMLMGLFSLPTFRTSSTVLGMSTGSISDSPGSTDAKKVGGGQKKTSA